MKKLVAVAALAFTTACGAAPSASAPDSLTAATGTQPPPPACEEQVDDLIAGQHIDAGSVSITNDGDSLIITYTADAPWYLYEVHAWAGTGSPPTNNRGIVVPGQFPYKASFSSPTSSYTFAIALADLDAECGEELKVVTHAVVKKLSNGQVVESQTAFGDGTPFTGPRWGFTASYDVCCDDGVCENESSSEFSGDWGTVDANASICWSEQSGAGPTLAAVLASSATDAFTLLAKEFVAAKLNADCTPWDGSVGPAMVAAHAILSDCVVDEAEAADAAALTALLAAYNNG